MFLTPADLAPFATIDPEKASAMIADAEASANVVAPCISDPLFMEIDAVRAILRRAIIRWHEASGGAVTQQTTPGFSLTTDTRTGQQSMFLPDELAQLRALCTSTTAASGAWSYSLAANIVP